MANLDKLKALAQAVDKRASERSAMTIAEEIMFDLGLDDIAEAWDDAMSPKTILGLIERLERAEAAEAITRETVDMLNAKSKRISELEAALKTLSRMSDVRTYPKYSAPMTEAQRIDAIHRTASRALGESNG